VNVASLHSNVMQLPHAALESKHCEACWDTTYSSATPIRGFVDRTAITDAPMTTVRFGVGARPGRRVRGLRFERDRCKRAPPGPPLLADEFPSGSCSALVTQEAAGKRSYRHVAEVRGSP